MAHFVQLERYEQGTFEPGELISFEIETPGPSFGASETGFVYHTEGYLKGAVDVLAPGDYMIFWAVGMLGEHPGSGEFFQLRLWVDDTFNPHWEPLAGSSTALKATASMGFAILQKTGTLPATIGLFNISGEQLHLNSPCGEAGSCQTARMLYYGLSEDDGDFTKILNDLEWEDCCYDMEELADRILRLTLRETDQYEKIEDLQIKYIELSNEFTYLSQAPQTYTFTITNNAAYQNNPAYIYDPSNIFLGTVICLTRVGYLHYFWAEGICTSLQIPSSNRWLLSNSAALKIPDENGDLYSPLSRYPLPQPTQGLVWILNGVSVVGYRNISLDAAGIEVISRSSTGNLGNNHSIRFSLMVAVEPPS